MADAYRPNKRELPKNSSPTKLSASENSLRYRIGHATMRRKQPKKALHLRPPPRPQHKYTDTGTANTAHASINSKPTTIGEVIIAKLQEPHHTSSQAA